MFKALKPERCGEKAQNVTLVKVQIGKVKVLKSVKIADLQDHNVSIVSLIRCELVDWLFSNSHAYIELK